MGLSVTLARGTTIPLVGLDTRLGRLTRESGQTRPLVMVPQTELRASIAMLGSPPQPAASLGRIADHALPFGIHDAQVEFRQRMILLRRPTIPDDGLPKIPRRPRGTTIAQPQRELGLGVASIGLDPGRIRDRVVGW